MGSRDERVAAYVQSILRLSPNSRDHCRVRACHCAAQQKLATTSSTRAVFVSLRPDSPVASSQHEQGSHAPRINGSVSRRAILRASCRLARDLRDHCGDSPVAGAGAAGTRAVWPSCLRDSTILYSSAIRPFGHSALVTVTNCGCAITFCDFR